MAPRLETARTHVRARQAEDLRMEESVRDSLRSSDEMTTRQSLAQLLTTLQGASLVRTKLVGDISASSERFLESQRSMFRARRPSGLPDLETRLFPEFMSLPATELAEAADTLLSGLYPGAWPKLPDLNILLSALLDKRDTAIALEQDDSDITPHIAPELQFSQALQAEVEDWVRRRFATGEHFTVERLLELSTAENWNEVRQRCLVMLLFRAFSPKETPFPATVSTLDGRFKMDVAEGSNLKFSPRLNDK
jgi:hypothetical protein